jgi:hypothetical protein
MKFMLHRNPVVPASPAERDVRVVSQKPRDRHVQVKK